MSEAPIRIVLADDHKLIRESWRMLLENNPRFSVIADCANGKDAIECAGLHLPDIMLVDINMHPVNGFEVIRQVTALYPAIRLIGMSVHNQPRYATRMMELGAKGYLTKSSPMEEIHHCIQEVLNGQSYICEEVRNMMPPNR